MARALCLARPNGGLNGAFGATADGLHKGGRISRRGGACPRPSWMQRTASACHHGRPQGSPLRVRELRRVVGFRRGWRAAPLRCWFAPMMPSRMQVTRAWCLNWSRKDPSCSWGRGRLALARADRRASRWERGGQADRALRRVRRARRPPAVGSPMPASADLRLCTPRHPPPPCGKPPLRETARNAVSRLPREGGVTGRPRIPNNGGGAHFPVTPPSRGSRKAPRFSEGGLLAGGRGFSQLRRKRRLLRAGS